MTHALAGQLFLAAFLAAALAVLYRVWRRLNARRVVLTHPLPPYLADKLRELYPQLGAAQLQQVERGLRQFFLASAMAQGRFVAMPSKVADAMWHEFILHTRAYERFCQQAFGRLLHHTPAEALAADPDRADKHFQGLRRAWVWSCRDEGIDPRQPQRLPTLFALDAALAIPAATATCPTAACSAPTAVPPTAARASAAGRRAVRPAAVMEAVMEAAVAAATEAQRSSRSTLPPRPSVTR